jgi:5'(3')-deoxyribonucleotidase
MERVTREEWDEERSREAAGEIHPCDNWAPEDCMCKGACSCHWIQDEIKTANMDQIALFDMDNTICDWDGSMVEDLKRVLPDLYTEPNMGRSTGYLEYWMGDGRNDRPEWVENLMAVIRTQVGWWKNLKPLRFGMWLLRHAIETGWEVNILTKGPATKPYAWSEKVEWCTTHIQPPAPITVCADKSLVYGKVLVDDYPPYIQKWLKYRRNGLVIMPAHDYNRNFHHPNVLRVTEDPNDEDRAARALVLAYGRKHGEPLILKEVL